ncbi:hypothetical protein ACULPM_08215 [Thermophilibacter sp. ZX-H3]|uniref:hypothetical protein n=1 Tax=unclassified Thermophilibacter TaxID=2847308 RepID=UPI00404087E2
MEQVFERFSLYDFFNLLFSGGLLILGLQILGFPVISHIEHGIGLPDNEVVYLLFMLLVCYVTGFILQGMGSWFDWHVFRSQTRMVNALLSDSGSIVHNKAKLRVYQSKAREILRRKKIALRERAFSGEQSEYIFAYCSYVIQMSGRCAKAEKMRALKGLAMQWSVCFAMLAVLGIVPFSCQVARSAPLADMVWTLLMIGTCAILAVVCFFRMRENLKYWIRMVLAMYEALDDLGLAGNGQRRSEG